MKPVIWRLYVDESGTFDSPRWDVSVAGVLVRDDGPRFARLKRELGSSFPWMPWPAHRAWLLEPLFEPVAVLAARDGVADREQRALARRVKSALESCAGGAVHEAVARLHAGRSPLPKLQAASAALAGAAPDLDTELRDRQRLTYGAVLRILSAHAAPFRDLEPPLVLAVHASEEERGVGIDDWSDAPRTDRARYLRLLAILFRRALMALSTAGEPVEVIAYVQRRGLWDDTLGASGALTTPLASAMLRASAAGFSRIVATSAYVESFRGEDVAPAHVYADFIAGIGRLVLRAGASLARTETQLLDEAFWTTRLVHRDGSLVAAAGSTHEKIESALGVPPSATPLPPATPLPDAAPLPPAARRRSVDAHRWAVEQAVEWCATLGSGRRP